jgi:uncharacterized protein (DUF433 family)
MALMVEAEPLPIAADPNGVLRVGGTRVTLDTVVGAFNAGCAPEEIVLRYDSLRLDDVTWSWATTSGTGERSTPIWLPGASVVTSNRLCQKGSSRGERYASGC